MSDAAKQQRDERHDHKRRAQKPWRRWYNLPLWKAIRVTQLGEHPLCQRCERDGRLVPATVCHHVYQHNGDWHLFITGPFESVCAPCHNADIQQEEALGHSPRIGVDGWPTDPRHRANAPARRAPSRG